MKNSIINTALEMGIIKNSEEITTDMLPFLESEILSRQQAVKAMLTLNNSLVIHQAPLTCKYDIWCQSGDTMVAVETKDRNQLSTDYNDSAVDYTKYESLRGIENKPGRLILFVSTYSDGKAYVYDVNDCSENLGEWTATRYTVRPECGKIKKKCQHFNKSEAKYVIKYDRK